MHDEEIHQTLLGCVGQACSTHEENKCYQNFSCKLERSRSVARTSSRWGNNIKRDVINSVSHGVACIRLVQCSDRWRAFLNTVMNFAFHKMVGVY